MEKKDASLVPKFKENLHGSLRSTHGNAIVTPMDFGGSTHPLQRIGLELPRGHGMAALTFVIRSEDGRC